MNLTLEIASKVKCRINIVLSKKEENLLPCKYWKLQSYNQEIIT